VLCFIAAPKAKADDSNQKTTVTFTDPVEVPGAGQHLLQPGTYVFRLKNAPTDRNIVEICNQDETKVLTTVLTIPNPQLKPASNSVLTFSEQPTGEPRAVKAWFSSSSNSGEQFVYERSRATALAKDANEPVLSTPAVMISATADSLTSAPIDAVSPSGESVATAQVVGAPSVAVVAVAPVPASDATVIAHPAPAIAIAVAPTPPVPDGSVAPVPPTNAATTTTAPPVEQPAGTPTPTADAVIATPAPSADMAASSSAPPAYSTPVTPATPVEQTATAPAPPVTSEPVAARSLPRTASSLPLIGLVGLLLLGTGFALFCVSKKKA
jgi:hypothetical protein